MGGYGSGEWQQRKRGTVEEHLAVRIGELQRERALTPGTVVEIRAGDRFSAEVEAEEHRLVFRYAVGRKGRDQWTRYAVPVPVSWTACNYGGRRPWFHCPKCSRRVSILYPASPGYHLRCRRCSGLLYEAQRMSRPSRLQRRQDQLNGRIIKGEDGWKYKPPRMHWSTFHRICDQAEALDEEMRAETAAFLEKLMQRGR